MSVAMPSRLGPGDQPGPRPTLPPGWRIATAHAVPSPKCRGGVSTTDPAGQSALPGSGAALGASSSPIFAPRMEAPK